MAGLQPAERVARADTHGGCSADERLMEKWLNPAAYGWVATREQAETFDGGSADDVAFVFTELPEDFGSEADV